MPKKAKRKGGPKPRGGVRGSTDGRLIERVPIDSLVADPGNARLHPERNLEAIKASLREFGQDLPLLVGPSERVIAGHGRLAAMRELGFAEVDIVRTDLEGERAQARAIADNRTAELARWDEDMLAASLTALAASDDALAALCGFSEAELARYVKEAAGGSGPDPDAVPAPPDEATTRPGDLWKLGDHRLTCGDSGSLEQVRRLTGGVMVHLVNTDPPYGIAVEPRSGAAMDAGLSSFPDQRKARRRGGAAAKQRPRDRPVENDGASDREFDALLDSWCSCMAASLLPGHAFYVWGGYSNLSRFPLSLAKHGLYFAQAIVWDKAHPVMGRKDFMSAFELAFYGWKEGAAHRFFGTRSIRGVWRVLPRGATAERVAVDQPIRLGRAGEGSLIVSPDNGADAARAVIVPDAGVDLSTVQDSETDLWHVRKVAPQSMVHLTEKPVELAKRAMIYSSKPGETVLDLFGGSGSTLIAAEMLGRKARLMEMDALYCDVIVRRWEQFTGKKAELERAA